MIKISLHRTMIISANDRLHWAQKARMTRDLRQLGYYSARNEERLDRAHLTVWVCYPNQRRQDADNLRPTLKALVDGMVTDAGLLPDDDNKHLIGPDVRVADELSQKPFAADVRLPADRGDGMIQWSTANTSHRLIETITNGPGYAPTGLNRDWFVSNGMITVCAHGQILREGWQTMPVEFTGQALVDLVNRYRASFSANQPPQLIHYSSLPAHCLDCAETRTI